MTTFPIRAWVAPSSKLRQLVACLLTLAAITLHGAATAQAPKPPRAPAVSSGEDIPKPQFEEEEEKKNNNSNKMPSARPDASAASGPPEPFGSRLFTGNFLHTRQDGLNPEYVVMPGDRVMVNTWGAVEMSEV